MWQDWSRDIEAHQRMEGILSSVLALSLCAGVWAALKVDEQSPLFTGRGSETTPVVLAIGAAIVMLFGFFLVRGLVPKIGRGGCVAAIVALSIATVGLVALGVGLSLAG